jgi:protocatechuate 3,4-dioxygenase beta subunit
VTGKVLTLSGKPAVGASVHFLSLSGGSDRPYAQAFTTSKADGSFYIFVSDSEMKNARGHGASNVLLATLGSETGFVCIDDDKFKRTVIELQTSATVAFHAVDENGAPVEGATVVVSNIETTQNSYRVDWGANGGAPWKAFTDKLGNASISNVPCGSYVNFTVDSGKYTALNDINLSDLTVNPGVQNLHLAIPGAITGKVVYADTNKPAADLFVSVTEPTRSHDYHVKTDANGVYSFPRVTPGTYSVSPGLYGDLSEEWAVAPKAGVTVEAGKTLSDTNFTIIKGGILTGKVTDKKTGNPVTDFRIDISVAGDYIAFPMIAMIHKDGTYKIHVPPGDISIMAYSPNVSMLNGNDAISMRLEDGETKTRDFSIDAVAPLRAIHGTAVDTKGAPVASANISLYSTGRPPQLDVTDAQGKFKFNDARSGDFLVGTVKRFATAGPVTVPNGDSDIKLSLDAPISYAKGIVTDQDGKPIKGAIVSLDMWPSGANGSGFGIKKSASDSMGRYWIGPIFSPFVYSVGAVAGGYSNAWSGQIAAPKGLPLDIPVTKLSKLDGVVSGVVLDEDDKPIPDVKVSLDWNNESSELTDSNGRFTLNHFPRGKARINAQKQGYYESNSEEAASGEKDFEITMVKAESQTQRPTLPSGDAVISGRVVDNHGQPIAGANIQASAFDPVAKKYYPAPIPNSDGDGKFEMDNVPAQFAYRLNVQLQGYVLDSKNEIKAHKPGESAGPDIVMDKLDSSISGKVIDSTGKPVAGEYVYPQGATRIDRSFITADDGTFRIPAPAGKKIVLSMFVKSGEYGNVEETGGSENVTIQLIMPKRHGDGTLAKKLLADALEASKKSHKGIAFNFYSSRAMPGNIDWFEDKDVQAIIGKYFIVLDIDTYEANDSWSNAGWARLRDPLTNKRIRYDGITLCDASGKIVNTPLNLTRDSDSAELSVNIVDALRKAAPQITDEEAKTLVNHINQDIAAKVK